MVFAELEISAEHSGKVVPFDCALMMHMCNAPQQYMYKLRREITSVSFAATAHMYELE
jgi:hypothetical protein